MMHYGRRQALRSEAENLAVPDPLFFSDIYYSPQSSLAGASSNKTLACQKILTQVTYETTSGKT